jgi:hypothetical protein
MHTSGILSPVASWFDEGGRSSVGTPMWAVRHERLDNVMHDLARMHSAEWSRCFMDAWSYISYNYKHFAYERFKRPKRSSREQNHRSSLMWITNHLLSIYISCASYMRSCYVLRKHRLFSRQGSMCTREGGSRRTSLDPSRIHSNEVVAFHLEDATYTNFFASSDIEC